MADRIVLHIGAPKTGTTFLQAVLFHNQERLADCGVLVPGSSRRDHGLAATGARQRADGGRREDWLRMVSQVRAWPGTAVISNEWFSMATADAAHRAVEELGPAETHLVFTARDFVDQVPAAWQETVKLGRSSSVDDFMASLHKQRGRWRWSVLDPVLALDRWRGDLPVDQIHVVTVPPRGSAPSLLWERFARVCQVSSDAFETLLDQARESLGAESARLLQRSGPLLRQAVDADNGHWNESYRWIQRYVSHQLLAPRGGSRITMRPCDVDALRERSSLTVKALAAAGYDVVGDLADLTSADPPAGARHPDDVTDAELLDVALPLAADLLGEVRVQTLRADAAEGRLQAAANARATDPSNSDDSGH